jgi:hypothetical protein
VRSYPDILLSEMSLALQHMHAASEWHHYSAFHPGFNLSPPPPRGLLFHHLTPDLLSLNDGHDRLGRPVPAGIGRAGPAMHEYVPSRPP